MYYYYYYYYYYCYKESARERGLREVPLYQ